MSKLAIIYWSGTGNTEAMAEAVKAAAGADASLFNCADFDAASAASYEAFALGCPAMGSEELEDGEFQPLFTSITPALSGKKVGLFGSYGWGSGEWMETWADTCSAAGMNVVGTVICCEAPDDDAIANLKDLAAKLA